MERNKQTINSIVSVVGDENEMASNQFKGGGNTSEEEEEDIEMEAEDRRREAALASNPCLRPNFKPTNNTITQQHITKFQELRRKRLQIKSKLNKTHINKSKGDKSHSKDYKDKDSKDTTESTSTPIEISSTNANFNNHAVSSTKHKKRHKLHWGDFPSFSVRFSGSSQT